MARGLMVWGHELRPGAWSGELRGPGAVSVSSAPTCLWTHLSDSPQPCDACNSLLPAVPARAGAGQRCLPRTWVASGVRPGAAACVPGPALPSLWLCSRILSEVLQGLDMLLGEQPRLPRRGPQEDRRHARAPVAPAAPPGPGPLW